MISIVQDLRVAWLWVNCFEGLDQIAANSHGCSHLKAGLGLEDIVPKSGSLS